MPVALIGGTFDPLHAGHLAYIREAAKYGGLLYAAVSDSDKHPPLVPLADRVQLLRAFGVVPVKTRDADALRSIKPDYYIKGEDWRGKLPAEEVQACEDLGIQIVYTSTRLNSSSDLLATYHVAADCRAVERFEACVHGQVEPRAPWTPVTDYSLEARRQVEGQHPQLILNHLIPCEDADILDYGCGPDGHLVELLREEVARRGWQVCVRGWDPQCRRTEPWFSRTSPPLKRVHDVVICREVLEHLTVVQMRRTISDLVRLSAGLIYLTTRFAENPKHLLDVQESDDLDPTHISMLTKSFLRTLFVLEGCKSRPDLEARMDWQRKGRCLVFEVGA